MHEAWRLFFYGLGMLLLVLLVGTAGFHLLEGHSVFLSLYMTVVTIFTVGFGDFFPVTEAGRFFAVIIITIGFCVLTFFVATVVTLLNEGHIVRLMRRRKMEKKLTESRNHIIVCGCGRVGQQVVKVLSRNRVPVVVIDREEAELDKTRDLQKTGDVFVLEGDATSEELLMAAGIERARGVIITIADDAYSLLTVMTCHGMNPDPRLLSELSMDTTKTNYLERVPLRLLARQSSAAAGWHWQ